MSLSIFDNDTFFETLNRFYEKYKNIELVQDSEQIYRFKMNKEDIEFGKTLSLSVHQNESELFTFCMTHYEQDQFKKQVKQPFMWDNSAREQFEESQFNDFLAHKDLYNAYQISVIHKGIVLKAEDMNGENQEDKINDLLCSMENDANFEEVVTSALYNKNNLKIKNQLKK